MLGIVGMSVCIQNVARGSKAEAPSLSNRAMCHVNAQARRKHQSESGLSSVGVKVCSCTARIFADTRGKTLLPCQQSWMISHRLERTRGPQSQTAAWRSIEVQLAITSCRTRQAMAWQPSLGPLEMRRRIGFLHMRECDPCSRPLPCPSRSRCAECAPT